jgi:hypothetical protein
LEKELKGKEEYDAVEWRDESEDATTPEGKVQLKKIEVQARSR